MEDLENLLREKNIIIPKNFNRYRIYLVEIKEKQFDKLENLGIIYMLSGNVKISRVDKDIHLEKNDIYILNKGRASIFEGIGSKNIALLLEIKDDYLTEYLKSKDYYFSNELNTLEKKKIIEILGKFFVDSIDSTMEDDEKEIMLEKLLSMLNISKDVDKKVEVSNIKSMVYEIADYILTDYSSISQKNLTLEDIADSYNISYHYLSRSFKKYLGENYTDFLLRIRLEKALDLILNTDDKIIYISETSGFNSVKAFNVAFKKAFNLSPTEFKHKFENNGNYYRKDLYQDEDTQKFIDDTSCIDYDSPRREELYYKVDLKSQEEEELLVRPLTIDINCLFDVSKNLYLLERAVNDLDIKRLIINILLVDEDIYVINNKDERRLLSSIDINNIINIVDENNIELLVILNNFDRDIVRKISRLTKIVTGTLGLNGLNKFIFGLKIDDIVSVLEEDSSYVEDILTSFQKELKERYEHIRYRWALSINDLEDMEDIELLNSFFKRLAYPDFLLTEVIYSHNNLEVESSIAKNLEVVRGLNEKAKKINKNMDILMDFNYVLKDIDLVDSKKMAYSEFYFLSLLLKSKLYNINIVSIKSVCENFLVRDILLYNNIGIRNNKYYILEYIRMLRGRLVYEDQGVLITEDNEEMTMIIYDDYLDYYNRYKGNNIILNDYNNQYTFEVTGLEGRYKIIEYNVRSSLNDPNDNLAYSEYENCISHTEKEYLENNITPKMKIEFKDIHSKLRYKTRKDFGDIVFLRILPI